MKLELYQCIGSTFCVSKPKTLKGGECVDYCLYGCVDKRLITSPKIEFVEVDLRKNHPISITFIDLTSYEIQNLLRFLSCLAGCLANVFDVCKIVFLHGKTTYVLICNGDGGKEKLAIVAHQPREESKEEGSQ